MRTRLGGGGLRGGEARTPILSLGTPTRSGSICARSEAQAQTRDTSHHRDMPNFQRGSVAVSFALRNPEVADGGLPQVGKYVDHVTETGLATTQHTDESGTQRLTRADPREGTCNIADLMQLVRGVVDPRRWYAKSSLWRSEHDCATRRCKSFLQACRAATTGMLP